MSAPRRCHGELDRARPRLRPRLGRGPPLLDVDYSSSARIQRLSGATRRAAMTLTDDELCAVRHRVAGVVDGIETTSAVKECLPTGIANVRAHLETTLALKARVPRGHSMSEFFSPSVSGDGPASKSLSTLRGWTKGSTSSAETALPTKPSSRSSGEYNEYLRERGHGCYL